MNTHRIFRSLLGVLTLVLALTASAAEEEKKADAPEWAELFGGASLPVVWQSASAASEKIDAALAARKLDGIAEWAETIHLALHALDDQVRVEDPERAKRLRAAFRQGAKIADDVLNGANHNEADEAAEAQRRLKSALALAKLRMPKEILEAAKQDVRSADSSAHRVER
jgi:hypothetical protein